MLKAMKPQLLSAVLECDKDGTWYYVHVPKEIREGYRQFEHRGAIAITAKVGKSTWQGSMLPWADGSAQISVNKKIRDKEGLVLGERIDIIVVPRERT